MNARLPTGQDRYAVGDLYRDAAVRRRSPGLGHSAQPVIATTPVSVRTLSWAVAGIVLFCAIFGTTASFSRTEDARGWIIPQGGLTRIKARQPGTIEAIRVREGDQVGKGAELMSLTASQSVRGGEAGQLQLENFEGEASAIAAQSQATIQGLNIRYKSLSERRRIIIQQISEIDHRISLAREQERLARSSLERANSLAARGFLSKADMDQANSRVLDSSDEIASLQTSALELKYRLADADAELARYPADLSLEQERHRQAAADVRQRRLTVEAQSHFSVTAPASSRIVALPVREGDTVGPQDTLAVSAAPGGGLFAELYLPARSSGFVKAGNRVELKVDAYPFQKFGTVPARIIEASETLLSPAEIRAPGVTPDGPTLRVMVRLERPTISAYGQEIEIRPGSTVSASIVIDRRSLLEWLLDPIYASRSR